MHQSPDRTRRARRLRSEMTLAETRLWQMVRDRQLDGLKFRRQAPLAGLTVDFYCAALKLVIELDGGIHEIRGPEDAERDARLAAAGFEVVRVGNEDFMQNPNGLIATIRRRVEQMRTSPPNPSGSA